jgi:hypothetical protein
MVPVTPFWFKQRQAKAEEAGPDLVRVQGPNLREAFLGIRRGDTGLWSAFVRQTTDGPDIAPTPAEIDTSYSAWEAAFEIYRKQMVI